MAKRELFYETIPDGIPEILQNDWGLTLDTDVDKEIAIKIFEWKFGPQDVYSNVKIESWQDGAGVKFTKGFFDGKLSFSLDKDKVSIVKLMIIIIKFVIGKSSAEHYIGTGLSMFDFFHSASNVYVLPNNVQRCVYLRIIELSNNNPSIPVDKNAINKLCNEDNSCSCWDIFECNAYNQNEHACLVKNDLIDAALHELDEKKVIRMVNSEIYIR